MLSFNFTDNTVTYNPNVSLLSLSEKEIGMFTNASSSFDNKSNVVNQTNDDFGVSQFICENWGVGVGGGR